MNKKLRCCVYCGVPNPTTKDHVPPKALFAKPRPQLITVPCCERCRIATSKDDEYFRNMLAMRQDTHEHPDVPEVLQKVLRSFQRPEHKGALQSLLSSIEDSEIITPGGIYLGRKSTYQVDNSRLDPVVERVVRGIYWHERGKIFPINGTVKSYNFESLALTEEKILSIAKMLSSGEERVVGLNAFRYKMVRASEEFFELWYLTFYDKVNFLAFLLNQGDSMNDAKVNQN